MMNNLSVTVKTTPLNQTSIFPLCRRSDHGGTLELGIKPAARAQHEQLCVPAVYILMCGIVSLFTEFPLPVRYRQVSNISLTLVDNKIVVHSDVVGASPGGAVPTTSSLST